MLALLKQWYWYDWLMFLIRLFNSATSVVAIVYLQGDLSFTSVILIVWIAIAFTVPWICLQYNFLYYLIAEIVLSGGFCLYLTTIIPDSLFEFLVPAFMIAANSAQKTYRWTAPISIIVIPSLQLLVLEQYSPWTALTLIYCLTFSVGFAFHLLVVNHRQNEIIRDQYHVLEQYLYQVEKVTLLEERTRLSKELHDTMGHSFTSVIMGLETLRSEISTKTGEHQINLLLDLTRKSLDEVRGYLHDLESPQESMSLLRSLQQLIEDFQKASRVQVVMRDFGEEIPMSKQAKMTFYRCLQESLTNAVRHGNATEIIVTVQFEEQQTRLEVQDNGIGVEQVQEGFGLTAMKERALDLHGQVIVYSKKGEGTLVTCTIPRQMDLQAEAIRILLVDDQPFIRESLRTILEGQSDLQVVAIAEDGAKGVELCEQTQPHIVLMDLDMPKLDGLSATKMMKLKWPHIRILILTTFVETEKAIEALSNGADAFLMKSNDSRELVETIRLLYRGGTLLSPDIKNQLFEQLATQPNKYSLGDAVLMKTEKPESKNRTNDYNLTSRELEILKLLSMGFRYKTIASKLFLSEGTVRNYSSTTFAKLRVRNREEAIVKAHEDGLF